LRQRCGAYFNLHKCQLTIATKPKFCILVHVETNQEE
jgi:hypothetical protein